jgi:predicted CXXCH cytochrome family protein
VIRTLLLLVLLSALPSAAEEVPERVDPGASCATSECHSEVEEIEQPHWDELGAECRECHAQQGDRHAFDLDAVPDLCDRCHEDVADAREAAELVHDPAEEDCLDCHDPHGGEFDSLLFAGTVKEVCSDCHDDITDDVDTARVVHDPAEEDCTDCHDPHSSTSKEGLFVTDRLVELCFDCHDEDDVLGEEYAHGPVAEGSCTECHDPHASRRSSLLVASGADLCRDCHEEVIERIESASEVHDPAEDDCLDCHRPHSGPHPTMLIAEKRELCEECHDDVVALAEEATVDHGAVLTGGECLNCHHPHASDHAPMLKAEPIDLCLECHDDPIESDGQKLRNMSLWLQRNPNWHQPIHDGGCVECHDPHGGENFRLLAETFPESFYTEFHEGAYALCFDCHDEDLVNVERTVAATGFRDGSRNLHFLHVNRKKGRTCRACHDMHASPNGFQVPERVRFAKWDMPLRFRHTETGGSCQPGCHKLATYDREKK